MDFINWLATAIFPAKRTKAKHTPIFSSKILFKHYFLFVFLTVSSNTIAQDLFFWTAMETDVKIETPAVGQLSIPIDDENVNLSKGQIIPSIPLSSIGCSALSDQLSLRYTSGSGVKVNDIASDAGLGWDIDLGGYIMREVRGFPDEKTLWTNAAPGVPGSVLTPSINGQKTSNGWLDYGDWNIDPNATYGGALYILPKTPISNKRLGESIQDLGADISSGVFPDYFRIMPQPFCQVQIPY